MARKSKSKNKPSNSQNEINLTTLLLEYLGKKPLVKKIKNKKWFKILLYFILPFLFVVGIVGYFYVKSRRKVVLTTSKSKNESDTSDDKSRRPIRP